MVRVFGGLELRRTRGAADAIAGFEGVAGHFVDGGDVVAAAGGDVHGPGRSAFAQLESAFITPITALGFIRAFVDAEVDGLHRISVQSLAVGDDFHGHPLALQLLEVGLLRRITGELLHADVFELNHHRRADVDLQRERAGLGGFGRLLVDDVHGLLAIDEVLEMIALGDDDVIVPILVLDLRLNLLRVADRAGDFDLGLSSVVLDHGLLPALRENAASAFFVEDAAVGFARLKVRLITADDGAELPGLGHLAAILDAGVALLDAVGKAQLEVSDVAAFPDEERVVVDLGVRITAGDADDGAVAHGPELGITIPAGEILAVEQALEARFEVGGVRDDGGLEAAEAEGKRDETRGRLLHKIIVKAPTS